MSSDNRPPLPRAGLATTRADEGTIEVDEDVARVFDELAALLTGRVTPKVTSRLAPRLRDRFGTEPGELVAVDVAPGWPLFWLLSCEVGRLSQCHPEARVLGSDLSHEPEWRVMPALGNEAVLEQACVWFPAGSLADIAVAVEVEGDKPYGGPTFRIHVRLEDSGRVTGLVQRLTEAAHDDSPWRHRVLRVSTHRDGVMFHPVEVPPVTREDLVLPPKVWETVDADVYRLLERRDRLAKAGLPTNRGLLLAGPPGTGKTALSRVLAHELAGRVTVLLCDTAVIKGHLAQLYESIEMLAPAVVVLDDIDLVTRSRDEAAFSGGMTLHTLLTTLDGAMTQHEGVVTIASTNTPDVLDPALRRACRFDRVITLDRPDKQLRATLIERLAQRAGCGIADDELDVLVGVTDGASGADLTELFRLAVLATDHDVPSGQDLIAAAHGGGWRPEARVGTYL